MTDITKPPEANKPPAEPLGLPAADWECGHDDPVHFAETVLGLTLHDGQRRWLRNSHRRENILVTGNRWGKSFASALKLVHHAIYRPRDMRYDTGGRYHAVSASITQDQATIIFDQAVRFIRDSSVLNKLVASIVRTPHPTIRLENGAVIEARSTQNRGEYLLGHDYDLFIFDEVAFESDPEYVVEEVVLMRLADREGRLDLVSTPSGRNWFYRRSQEVIAGKRPGYFQEGDSRENIHLPRAFLDERVKYFTDRRMQQNICGQFVDAGGEVIAGKHIDAALAGFDSLPRLGEDVRYFSGWDLARKRTATVGITVAVEGKTARVVALERFTQMDWDIVLERIKARQRKYPGTLVIDGTGLGDVILNQLQEYKPISVIFTQPTKSALLMNVDLIHAQGRLFYQRWELPDGPGRIWAFEDELRSARWDDNNECDSLMALGLALWELRTQDAPVIQPRIGKV